MAARVVGGRTAANTVQKILSRPSNLDNLLTSLAALRHRYPGAVFDRYLDKLPTVSEAAHVFATAALIGDVRLAADVSVWYGCVLRGDINSIEVG